MKPRQRIDQWLWFARLVKTRTLAASLVANGRLRVNRAKIAKPSHEIGPGDVVTFAYAGRVRIFESLACGERRGPAAEAQALYRDLDASSDNPAASQNMLQNRPSLAIDRSE